MAVPTPESYEQAAQRIQEIKDDMYALSLKRSDLQKEAAEAGAAAWRLANAEQRKQMIRQGWEVIERVLNFPPGF